MDTGVSEDTAIEIAQAATWEYDRIAELARLAWSKSPEDGFILKRLKRSNSLAYVAKARGHIVGVTTAHWFNDRVACSDETVVLPSWSGRGIGTSLLDAMTKRLKLKGFRHLQGESSVEDTKSLLFFLHYGFKPRKISQGNDGFFSWEVVYTMRYDL